MPVSRIISAVAARIFMPNDNETEADKSYKDIHITNFPCMTLTEKIKIILGLVLNFVRTHAVDDSETSIDHEKWVMVQKTGTQFTLNGQPFYVCGFNTYWLMVFAADYETRGKVSDVLQQASSIGLNISRTWVFNDGGYRALQLSPGKYDEEDFKVTYCSIVRALACYDIYMANMRHFYVWSQLLLHSSGGYVPSRSPKGRSSPALWLITKNKFEGRNRGNNND